MILMNIVVGYADQNLDEVVGDRFRSPTVFKGPRESYSGVLHRTQSIKATPLIRFAERLDEVRIAYVFTRKQKACRPYWLA